MFQFHGMSSFQLWKCNIWLLQLGKSSLEKLELRRLFDGVEATYFKSQPSQENIGSKDTPCRKWQKKGQGRQKIGHFLLKLHRWYQKKFATLKGSSSSCRDGVSMFGDIRQVWLELESPNCRGGGTWSQNVFLSSPPLEKILITQMAKIHAIQFNRQ